MKVFEYKINNIDFSPKSGLHQKCDSNFIFFSLKFLPCRKAMKMELSRLPRRVEFLNK